MPLYNFGCPKCNKNYKKILSAEKAKEKNYCIDDGEELVRNYSPPSTLVKEIIDNGLQIRAVERYTNADEVLKQHEQVGDQNKYKTDL